LIVRLHVLIRELESQGEKIRNEGLFIIAKGDGGEGKVEYVFMLVLFGHIAKLE
jgi:hypothetical protein